MIGARTARSAAALTLAFAGTGTVSFVAAPQAAAAGHDGICKDANGTTVVVDFQALGGGLVIRCAQNIPPGSTGLDALKLAGVPYAGVARWGDAFICRIYNRPSAAETIPIAGMPGYKEACINTPPAKGYWSYWWSTNGGSWQYSQWGVKNRSAIKGGFEGWSFSLNATATTNPQPRLRPVRPVTAAPPSTSSQPPATSSRPAAPSSSARPSAPGAGSGSASSAAGSTAQAAPGSAEAGASSSSGSAAAAAGSDTSATENATATSLPPSLAAKESSSASTAATSGTTSSAGGAPQHGTDGGPTVAAGVRVADSDKLARQAREQTSSSLNTATVVGAGVLAFLAVLGAGTALRHRNTP